MECGSSNSSLVETCREVLRTIKGVTQVRKIREAIEGIRYYIMNIVGGHQAVHGIMLKRNGFAVKFDDHSVNV